MLRITLLLLALLALPVFAQAPASSPQVLVIVLDGLRPDQVRAFQTPRMYILREEGVFFANHHAVYPTVTRVNAPSIMTGAYPDVHGIMDNAVYFPEVDAERSLSTGSRSNLERIKETATGGLLTCPDLGEILAKAGMNLFVGSSGSSGSAYLLNHNGHGLVVNNDFVLPASAEPEVHARIGETPPSDHPNAARNWRAIEAYLAFGLEARLAVLWLSDPDHTAHAMGLGDPVTRVALSTIDGQIAMLLERLEAEGRLAHTNILLTSDHGFASYVEKGDLQGVLRGFMEAQGQPAGNLIISGQGLYLREDKEQLLPLLVRRLQEETWIGALFTRGGGPVEGSIPGTFSMSLVNLDHDRAPDLIISPGWSDALNKHDWPGTTFTQGVAGHGSASPWEIHNTLIAVGPAFKVQHHSEVPSGNVDLAPTILHLLGVPVPDHMQGRILWEALRDAPAGTTPAPARKTWTVMGTNGVEYELSMSLAGDTQYMHSARRLAPR